MIAGITHLTTESPLEPGIAWGTAAGFDLDFATEVELPASFEGVEDSDHILPLALLAAPSGIRLEVVDHARSSGRRGAYEGIFRCPPPAPGLPGTPVTGREALGDILRQTGTLTDPVHCALPGLSGAAWFDSAAVAGGLAGVLCHVEDVRAEAAFWSDFAKARWITAGAEAAWGAISSPLLPAKCRMVLVRDDGKRTPHAMNDLGFPSIGVASTSIEPDLARAVAAGATVRSEPIVTAVGGRRLQMALIVTPGGAPVELLSVHRSGARPATAGPEARVAPHSL